MSNINYYIDCYVLDSSGVIECDGEPNFSDARDFENRMVFDSEKEAQEFADNYINNTPNLHPTFKCVVSEWDEDYYNSDDNE